MEAARSIPQAFLWPAYRFPGPSGPSGPRMEVKNEISGWERNKSQEECIEHCWPGCRPGALPNIGEGELLQNESDDHLNDGCLLANVASFMWTVTRLPDSTAALGRTVMLRSSEKPPIVL